MAKSGKLWFGVAAVAAAVSVLMNVAMGPSGGSTGAAKEETAYERVMRTGVIRCGYITGWEPLFSKDVTTGKLGGIYYDYVEAIGRATGLKIDWAMEVGSGDYAQALKSGKIDVMCAGLGYTGTRARVVDYVYPSMYASYNIYVRADDKRFDGDWKKLNAEGVKLAVMDGELGSIVAPQAFPKAGTVSLPQLSSIADVLNTVATGKADAVTWDSYPASQFMKANPGKLKKLQLERPFRVLVGGVVVDKGETDLKNLLDAATIAVISTGEMADILYVSNKLPKSDYLLPLVGYESPK